MKKLLFVVLVFIGLICCKDRDQEQTLLPPATQNGSNTGGALIDGEVWVAKDEYPTLNGGGVNATIYEQENGEYKMKIVFCYFNNLDNRIVIYLSDVSEITAKTYILDEKNVAGYENGLDYYNTNINFTGSISFSKFDKVEKIASGKFSFKAKNKDGKTVNVTDGRFDKRFL